MGGAGGMYVREEKYIEALEGWGGASWKKEINWTT